MVLNQVLEAEGAAYDEGGIEAVVFTAEGDMRQALNNAQATAAGLEASSSATPSERSHDWSGQATTAGFGIISNQNVFKAAAPSPPPGQRRLSPEGVST